MTTTPGPVDPSARPRSDDAALDAWFWSALATHHAHLGEVSGSARRYHPEVSLFAGIDPSIGVGDPAAWDDLATLVGVGGETFLASVGPAVDAPPGWTTVASIDGMQLVLTRPDQLHAGVADAVPANGRVTRDLDDHDVTAMLELVALTEPGPFRPRTIEMGRYVGTFDDGRLLAMAGERAHVPGFTEISAVCTHPEAQGQGLAADLIRDVATGIQARGETPFLNVAAENHRALALYERLGFTVRRPFTVRVLQFGATGDG